MNLTFKIAFIFFALFIASPCLAYSQENKSSNVEIPFYIDVICFKGENDSAARVDVYSVVPYQSLNS